MKTYTIRPIADPAATHFPSEADWGGAEIARIDEHAWTDHAFLPHCEARALYSTKSLFLYFRTEDWELSASRTADGEEVWRDNCVEFFFSPSEDLSIPYLNFEFNLLGAMLLGVGESRDRRRRISATDLMAIVRKSDYTQPIVDRSEGRKVWSLEAAIPIELILRLTGCESPRGRTTWRGNFNVCAEEVTHPYYGNWNRIETPTPDFHRPEFFGRIVFG